MKERWIKRLGSQRSGFRYVDGDGRAIADLRVLTRIDALRVPPAWRDVHIAPDARRSVQAWGYDARGRKQYRYNQKAVERRELRKYHRVRQLAKSLPRIRQTLRTESRGRELTRNTVCAIALRLISESLFRPGSERYAKENGSFGITTLRKNHVELRSDGGGAVFSYPGKSSKHQRQRIVNPELVRLVTRVHRTPGTRLFRYRHDRRWCDLDARTLMVYLRSRVGPFAVKDFRTWGGTLRAATVLSELGKPRGPAEAKRNVALAMRLVSAELGNTPAICRTSYVHPMVLARYLDAGETIVPRAGPRAHSTSQTFAHSPEERALIAFLGKHFPERRRRTRETFARAA
jgi:DNA topoisomerase-1